MFKMDDDVVIKQICESSEAEFNKTISKWRKLRIFTLFLAGVSMLGLVINIYDRSADAVGARFIAIAAMHFVVSANMDSKIKLALMYSRLKKTAADIDPA